MPRKGENIYKRKDGRWEARYVKGCTTEGKTAYGYCYGKTYREAKAKVTEAKARLVQNLPHTGGGTRRCFSSYCDEWLKINRSKVKESTYVKYLSMLDKRKAGSGDFRPWRICLRVRTSTLFWLPCRTTVTWRSALPRRMPASMSSARSLPL